jgi:hypothetical protein
VHDTLDELPIVTVLCASLSEHDIDARCCPSAEVAAERFLPLG